MLQNQGGWYSYISPAQLPLKYHLVQAGTFSLSDTLN